MLIAVVFPEAHTYAESLGHSREIPDLHGVSERVVARLRGKLSYRLDGKFGHGKLALLV
jgi:hypothetical protein